MERILIKASRNQNIEPLISSLRRILANYGFDERYYERYHERYYERYHERYYDYEFYRRRVIVDTFEDDYDELKVTDYLIRQVHNFDLILFINGFEFKNLIFQIGAALSKRKIVVLLDSRQSLDRRNLFYGQNLFVIKFNEHNGYFEDNRLKKILNLSSNNLLTPLGKNYNKVNFATYTQTKSGIPRAIEFNEKLSRFFYQNYRVRLINQESIEGSWKSFFEIPNLDKLFELIEKFVFFIPEWRKRKEENRQLQLENKKTEIEILKEEILLNDLKQDLEMNRVIKLLTIIEKYKDLGFRSVQFKEDLLLKVDERNNISLLEPPKLDNENDS